MAKRSQLAKEMRVCRFLDWRMFLSVSAPVFSLLFGHFTGESEPSSIIRRPFFYWIYSLNRILQQTDCLSRFLPSSCCWGGQGVWTRYIYVLRHHYRTIYNWHSFMSSPSLELKLKRFYYCSTWSSSSSSVFCQLKDPTSQDVTRKIQFNLIWFRGRRSKEETVWGSEFNQLDI